LEALCPEAIVDEVIAAMRRAHSYEEPAYDVYPLRPAPSCLGQGRLGRLPGPKPLREWAQIVKVRLNAGGVQVVGDLGRPVEYVAVVCGSGGTLLADAASARADVLVTGDVRFHDAVAALAQGIALVLPGHYATERPGVEDLVGRLRDQWPVLHVWASERERDPLSWAL
jgi:putative NIF3 family GTP cyclohydrolase 1 type 2